MIIMMIDEHWWMLLYHNLINFKTGKVETKIWTKEVQNELKSEEDRKETDIFERKEKKRKEKER